MKLEVAECIAEWMESSGYDAKVCDDYSGRGMFGATTAGIVTTEDAETIDRVAARCGIDESELPGRSDSMGLRTIYY